MSKKENIQHTGESIEDQPVINVNVDAGQAVQRAVDDAKGKFDVNEERGKIRKEENHRIREITALGDKHGMKGEAGEAVKSGEHLEAFRVKVLERLGQIKPIDPLVNNLGMGEKEIKNFSMMRAIRGLMDNNMEKVAPFEKAMSDEVAKKMNKAARGFFIPDDVMHHRDLTVGTPTSPGTGGGNVVETELLSQSFIELLRNRMVTKQLGIRIMDGLEGDVLIPKQTGGGVAYWVAENTAITAESDQTFTQVSMRPKTLGAYTDISRKLIIQSSIGIENFVKQDLANVLAIEVDRAVIEGSNHGNSNEPTGILLTSSIGDVAINGGNPTYGNMISLWTDTATANANVADMGYLTTPAMCGQLMQTYINSTGGESPVWVGGPGDGSIIGFKAMISNQVPTDMSSDNNTAIIFGNWADIILGTWSGFDVLIDPYSGGTAGTVRTIIHHDCDVAVRHAESFSAIIDAATPS